MENFNLGKNEGLKKRSTTEKVSNFVKASLLSKLLDKSKLNKNLADNLYANRILEEELIAPNEFFSGFSPSLPEGTKIIVVHGSHYANIGDKMYYIRQFKEGFDLVDNTQDFIPREDTYYPRWQKQKKMLFKKKYGLSVATKATHQREFYRYDESTDDLDNWIIHNDMGKIKKDPKVEGGTWWLKGEPYKAMEARSLIKDEPAGRHLFAKQSALEDSIGRPLKRHRELIGDIEERGDFKDGGITITPTSEEDLSNIKDLKSFTYNPITKSMERGIFYNPKEPKDEKDVYKNSNEYEDTEK